MTAGIWHLDVTDCRRCGAIIGSDAVYCGDCEREDSNPVRLADIGDRPDWQSSRLHPYPSWQITYQHVYDARKRAVCTCWNEDLLPGRFDIRGNWRVLSRFEIPGSGV